MPTEKQFSDDNQDTCPKHLEHSVAKPVGVDVQAFFHLFYKWLDNVTHQNEYEMIHPKKDIIPCCSVPQTVAEPDEKQRYRTRNHQCKMAARFFL